jgi:thiamine biosynthesis lipoprotein
VTVNLQRICMGGLLVLGMAAGCRRPELRVVEKTWAVMGTFATVSVAPRERDRLDESERICGESLRDIEERLSVFRPDSDVSRLNRAAGREAVEISGMARDALARSMFYAELTGGAFDPTVAPLMRFWGFHGGTIPGAMPSDAEVRKAAEMIGYTGLRLTDRSAFLARPGMSVDLGGIAKGYAVDRCFERMREAGISNMLVNLGGNMRCSGQPHVGRTWRVGVRNPFSVDETVGTIEMGNGWAVATSGNYERFVTIGGRRYAHVMDPRTGKPVLGMASVTVISDTAVEADAMSTALFVMGPEASREVRVSLPACGAMFIPDEQPVRLLVTPGFRRYFTPHPAWADRVTELDE